MAQNTVLHDDALTDVIFNERTFGWDTRFPSRWPANGWFIRTDTNALYQNTGTEAGPAWALRGGLTAHEHSGTGDGGVLHSTDTLVDLNGSNVSLLTLAVL